MPPQSLASGATRTTVSSTLLCLLLLAACSAESPSQTSSSPAFILLALEAGDVACYATLRDAKGLESQEFADFEICEQGDLIGHSVHLTFGEAQVLAESCAGDPDCAESQTVRLIQKMAALDSESFRPETSMPSFEAQVQHLESAQAFYDFLVHHDGGIVDLDLELDPTVEPFQENASTFFALWVECEDLAPEEPPSAMSCWGVEIQARGVLAPLGTPPRLRGRFRVEGILGPHQGLFAVPLELLSEERDSKTSRRLASGPQGHRQ